MLSPVTANRVAKRWPFRGQWRLAYWLGANPSSLPEGRVVQLADGRKFRIRKDGMYLRMFTEGDYLDYETEMFGHVAKPGDIVADIGANFGVYTTLFSRLVGDSGKVHAFEPSRQIFEELSDHIQLNECNNVVLNNFGLGEEEAHKTLYTFAGLPHGHSSTSTLGRKDAVESEIAIRVFDNYCAAKQIDHIDLIKLDIEGSELSMLKGGLTTLCSNTPMLLVEMNDETARNFGYEPSDLLRFLKEHTSINTFLAFREKSFVVLPEIGDIQNGEMILCANDKLHRQRLQQLPGLQFEDGSEPARCPVCQATMTTASRFVASHDANAYCLNCDALVTEVDTKRKNATIPEATPAHRPRAHDWSRWIEKSALRQKDTLIVGTSHAVRSLQAQLGDSKPSVLTKEDFNQQDSELVVPPDMHDLKYSSIVLCDLSSWGDPVALLRTLKSLLSRNGRIYLSLPNWRGRHLHQQQSALLKQNPDMQIAYSSRTLRVAAQRAELEPKILTIWSDPHWYLSIRQNKVVWPPPQRKSLRASLIMPWLQIADWLAPQENDIVSAVLVAKD